MERFFAVTRGPLYAMGFRAAMAATAGIRLAILALALPFRRKISLRWSVAKWLAVLRWAFGLDRIVNT